MMSDDKQKPDQIVAEASFKARNIAIEHYKTKSALVNIGPAGGPSVGQQLQVGKRPMLANDHPTILRLRFP
jgi:hypothetical protein